MRTPTRSALVALVLAAAQLPGHAQSIEISRERSTGSLPLAAAPTVPTATAAAPASKTGYQLNTDQPIHEGLQAWARAQDWELRWYPPVSWRTLRAADFSNAMDLVAAVTEVIDILRDEGKQLRLRVSDGNRFIEVLSTEVSQ